MDKRIEELVIFTKEKYSLQEFYLHEFIIYRSITNLKDTVYTLSMEWFPSRVKI